MNATRCSLVIGLTLLGWPVELAAQELQMLLSVAAAGQYTAGQRAGTDAVMTGPEADPRPGGVGFSGQCSTQTQPWEKWVQQPATAPLSLEVNVRAAVGTQVSINLAGQNYTVDGVGLETESPTNRFFPNIKSHQPYPMTVSGPNWDYIKVVFKGYTARQLLSKRGPRAIPRPFKTLLNGEDFLDTEALEAEFSAGNNSTNWLIEVRPDRGLRPVLLLRRFRWNWDGWQG